MNYVFNYALYRVIVFILQLTKKFGYLSRFLVSIGGKYLSDNMRKKMTKRIIKFFVTNPSLYPSLILFYIHQHKQKRVYYRVTTLFTRTLAYTLH